MMVRPFKEKRSFYRRNGKFRNANNLGKNQKIEKLLVPIGAYVHLVCYKQEEKCNISFLVLLSILIMKKTYILKDFMVMSKFDLIFTYKTQGIFHKQ